MEIVKLPAGTIAAPDTDCIRIQQSSDGRFYLEGNLLAPSDAEGVAESVTLVGTDPFPNYEAAEAAGLAWANNCSVAILHVAHSDGTMPLPDPA